jgi:hypothetical protein
VFWILGKVQTGIKKAVFGEYLVLIVGCPIHLFMSLYTLVGFSFLNNFAFNL